MASTIKKLTGTGNIGKASTLLRCFAHPLRLRLLSFIHDNGRVNVNRIYAALKLEQSITSQHLRILRDEGLVVAEKEGRLIHYSLDYGKIAHIERAIRAFSES